MSITILLADDHAILRQGLRVLLEAEPDFEVVGEASDGPETIREIESLRPDVVVLDLELPGLSGLEVTRHIQQTRLSTRAIILTMYAGEAYVVEALRRGANAYILKGSGAQELTKAIRKVMQNNIYLGPEFDERSIQAFMQRVHAQDLDPYETITDREREVLILAARGHSNPEIARLLSISVRTVETHRAHIMQKLGVHNQTELVRFALSRGIIRLDDDWSLPANDSII